MCIKLFKVFFVFWNLMLISLKCGFVFYNVFFFMKIVLFLFSKFLGWWFSIILLNIWIFMKIIIDFILFKEKNVIY